MTEAAASARVFITFDIIGYCASFASWIDCLTKSAKKPPVTASNSLSASGR